MLYEVLDADESRGGDGDLDFGEFAHRQLGGKGGGARGRRGKPVGGLDWGQGGRSWAVHGKVGAAAALCSSGGVPAVESERGRDGRTSGSWRRWWCSLFVKEGTAEVSSTVSC